MALHRYSLADYTLNITFPEDTGLEAMSIGGPGETVDGVNGNGSFVGNISISRSSNLWETQGDATGSWVHNQNLNRTGTITVDIKQISDQILKLIQACQVFESIDHYEGLYITVKSAAENSNVVCEATDCYIQKTPDQVYGDTASNQSWVFTCGKINWNSVNA